MLELDIIKVHCRIEPDFIDDDALLDTYANAARRLVETHTGRTLYATLAEVPKDGEGNVADEHYLLLDDAVTTAMLLLIGHWYENREAAVIGATATDLPLAVDALIIPYRHYHF
jgi:hypothetical protein